MSNRKLEGLEPNKPLQEAAAIENLIEWLRDSPSKPSDKIEMARLVLRGVALRLRGEDTRMEEYVPRPHPSGRPRGIPAMKAPKRKTIDASEVGVSLTLSDKALKDFERLEEQAIGAAPSAPLMFK